MKRLIGALLLVVGLVTSAAACGGGGYEQCDYAHNGHHHGEPPTEGQ